MKLSSTVNAFNSATSFAAKAAKRSAKAAKRVALDTKDYAVASSAVAKQFPRAVRVAYSLRKATRMFR